MNAAIASALPMARGARGRPVGRGEEHPLVAVLCASARGPATAAGVALALARGLGAGCGLAGAVGGGAGSSLPPTPAARRAETRVRRRGLPARASGRLVWLVDRRGPLPGGDAVAGAAAMSAELGRAAAAARVPGAAVLPLVRTAALDRVLAWYDAIVVVNEPAAPEAMLEQALASLALLGRPLAAWAPPSRLAAALAVGGARAPIEAQQAVAALGLGREARDG